MASSQSSQDQVSEDVASLRSGVSGGTGGASETSSQRSDSKFLRRERARAEGDEGDLLEQKRSLQDGVFSCMYTLVRQSALSNWKFAALKVLLEGLMGLIVIFNPSINAWRINTGNPVWQVIRWTVWRSPIVRLYGYTTYITIMYVMAAAVFLAVAGLVWLTLAMRKTEQSKWLRLAAVVLHVVFDAMFVMLYVSFFDYFVFTANCNFFDKVKDHVYFEGVMCLEMPHVLHMTVGLITAAIFFCVTALLVVASSDLNPVSLSYLASPAAITRLKILTAKAVYVIAANDFQGWPKPQAILLILSVALICWWNFRRLPFYRSSVNVVWCSMWFGILYVSGLLAYLVFSKDVTEQRRRDVTMLVLYGIFPSIAGGLLIGAVHAWWALRPAKKFLHLAPGAKIQKVHVFANPLEVEVLSRVMRNFDQDGGVDDAAAALGETIIKAGMQVFPNSPFLFILYANFQLEVRKDGPAARTQLQLAARHAPTLVEKYQIFCTGEASKRLKDSQDGGMDLQAYIEFRRNFRAVLRVHKEVLLLQADLWTLMLRSSLRVAEVDKALDALEGSTARAHQVYKRVLERYPTNGKLLRCYGKFLEDVKHDPVAASRVYGEANRNGGADAIMSLDLSRVQGAADKPDFITGMSIEDDAVVVINAEGTIMMVSQAVQTVFGYPKIELEGANVSLLMPQPFSQRHNGYLQRYGNGGEPHILDTVREVVALHKERYVFPMALCVTKMSGTGADSIFLAVARPLPPSSLTMRAWLAPNGVFLCGDQQFASQCGLMEHELVGRSLASLVDDPDRVVEQLLERCQEASAADLQAGSVREVLRLRHRFVDPEPLAVTVGLAGTDAQRILVLNCSRTDGQEGNMLVVDTHMKIRFASCGMGPLLGFPTRRLASMRLDQLLPPPYNALHAKYLSDPPSDVRPTSCRAGKVVHLLHESGLAVPVRLKIHVSSAADLALTLYVVQVAKVAPREPLDEKHLVVKSDFSGRVLSVSPHDSELFGFHAADMVGRSLCDTIDIFQEWRERAGESQMQLLMLALLDKEHEVPGTSWRVRVQAPAADGAKAAISGMKDAGSKSACLQVELHEASDEEEDREAGEGPGETSGRTGTHARVTLWRRDLLTGVMELDEDLVIRRASPLTGLIVGMPSTAVLKKPIQRFLDIPLDTTWDKLTAAHTRHKQRGGLKAPSGRGTISPLMAFIGPHPDTGTMRIVVQGVQVLAPGGRSKVTITMHPDTTYAGAHADLMRVLHLDVGSGQQHDHSRHHPHHGQRELQLQQQQQQQQQQHRQHRQSDGSEVQLQPEGEVGSQPAELRRDRQRGAGAGESGAGCRREVLASRALRAPSSSQLLPGGGEGAGGERGDGDDRRSDDGGDGGDRGDRSGGYKDGKGRPGGGSDSDPDADDDPREPTKLHSRAASKSDFVAQWVRTLTKRSSRTEEHHHGGTQQPQQQHQPQQSQQSPQQQHVGEQRPSTSAAITAVAMPQARASTPPPRTPPPPGLLSSASGLPGIPEEGVVAAAERRAAPRTAGCKETAASGSWAAAPVGGALGDLGDSPATAPVTRQGSRALTTTSVGQGRGVGGSLETPGSDAVGAGGGDGGDGDGGGAAKWEKGSDGDSSADDSQSASGISSVTGSQAASELLIDSRRQRLLKALQKLLMGPLLMVPLERLRLHSYALLAVVLATHIVCYVVVNREIKEEHHEIDLVYRQALAMDRSQLITVRAMMGAFCERANVTAKVSVCANSLDYTMGKLRENADFMEQHHQFVYMGDSSKDTIKLMPEVFNLWTRPDIEYDAYLDTTPPQVRHEVTGVWQLGSRFIAAAREALYWLPVLRDEYRLHRTFQFLVTNGLGPLFAGYAASLDLLVDSAWKSVDKLRITIIVLLVVEAICIQLSCLVYEVFLVQRLERSRLVGILAMVGLPGPVLRQLATKEAKILDDGGDDEDDGDDSDDEEAVERRAPAAGSSPAAAAGGDAISRNGKGQDTVVRTAAAASRQQGQDGVQLGAAAGPKALFRQADRGPAGDDDDKAATKDRGAIAAVEDGRCEAKAIGTKDEAVTRAGKRDAASAAKCSGSGGDDGGGGDDDAVQPREKPLTRVEAATVAAAASGQSRVGGLRINGKVLIPSYANLAKFLVPYALWNIAVVVVYVFSLLELNSMQGPLASLNMASHIIYRYTRVRAIAFGFVSQDDSVSRSLWRDMLRTELRLFESEYDALMYGGIPITQAKAVFNQPVPASTFASTSFSQEFFRAKRCFRFQQDDCFQPGDEYYEVSHNGLDVMVRRMMSEMNLLCEDAEEDVAYSGTRYMFMYNVGGRDLYEGLQQAAQLFVDYSVEHYNKVADLHTILLAATLILAAMYVVFILWPHLARLKNDAMRQSALLSHVPPEIDVRGHVRGVFKRAQQGAGMRRGRGGGVRRYEQQGRWWNGGAAAGPAAPMVPLT